MNDGFDDGAQIAPEPVGRASGSGWWRPVRESNPCRRRERAVSWATRRTGRIERQSYRLAQKKPPSSVA